MAFDYLDAFKLACELMTSGHPRHEEALKATARDLMELCQGATLDGVNWTPEAQAQWLVREFRRSYNWEKAGTVDLVELFNRKFHPPAELRAVSLDRSTSGRQCGSCEDMGVTKVGDFEFRWCECPAGQRLRDDVPTYLDICVSTAKRSFIFEKMPPLRAPMRGKELKRILRKS